MRFKGYRPGQGELFGYRPADVLDNDDPAYVVAEVVSLLDLRALKWQGEGAGQPPYHPALLLSILLYGVIRGLFSSRALAAACRRDTGFIYLSGGARPSFKTLCDFRNTHGEALGALEDSGIDLCVPAALLGVAHNIMVLLRWRRSGGGSAVAAAQVGHVRSAAVAGINACLLNRVMAPRRLALVPALSL